MMNRFHSEKEKRRKLKGKKKWMGLDLPYPRSTPLSLFTRNLFFSFLFFIFLLQFFFLRYDRFLLLSFSFFKNMTNFLLTPNRKFFSLKKMNI